MGGANGRRAGGRVVCRAVLYEPGRVRPALSRDAMWVRGALVGSVLLAVAVWRAAVAAREHIKVGLILPLEGSRGFEQCAAATTLAVDRAHDDGYLIGVDVR